MAGTLHNQFRRRTVVNGIVHFVLYRGKKGFGGFAVPVIIGGSCIQVGDFLIKSAFTGTDFLNFTDQVFKIIIIKDFTVDQPFFVQHISLPDKCFQHPRRPLAELGGTRGICTVADSDNRREAVELILISSAVVWATCAKNAQVESSISSPES